MSSSAAWLQSYGVVAILRAGSSEVAVELGQACIDGGLTAIEVSLTTPSAAQAIRRLRGYAGDRALVGTGTVLRERDASEMIDSGAQFIVTPAVAPGVASVTKSMAIPVLMGALTPTEIVAARELGADFVKLFPAQPLGPAYLRQLRAPFPNIPFVPTGGIDIGNAKEWFEAGAVAIAVGGGLSKGSAEEARIMASRFARLVIEIRSEPK